MVSKKIEKNNISTPTPVFIPKRIEDDSLDSKTKENVLHSSELISLKDASASVTSEQRAHLKSMQQKMTVHQFQSLIQGFQSFKRQLIAFASASQALVRELEQAQSCLPESKLKKGITEDLNLVIDSASLIANTHLSWAESLQNQVESPLLDMNKELVTRGETTQKYNQKKIETLAEMLQKEEEISYRMGKRNKRDLQTLQSSLSRRLKISEEITKLTCENRTLLDEIMQDNLEPILSISSRATRPLLNNYDRIIEGLDKVR